ncbi:MAG TPA: transposase [Usitatibacter sp.]|jgi:putative transposase|nr:transposase [Usitatibacter sp.]
MHVRQRGNNRGDCFVCATDYAMYLRLLAEAREREGCEVHAYVLMTNHVHLLLTGRQADSVSRTMKRVGESYVRYFNRAHSRTGTLWEGRFNSSVVDTEAYLLRCYRYVERNPVRARMVAQASHYRWSSHRANAHGDRDDLVSPHPLYTALGLTAEARRHSYRALFATSETEVEVEEIRAALNGSFALGSPAFMQELEKLLGRRVERMTRGRTRHSAVLRT